MCTLVVVASKVEVVEGWKHIMENAFVAPAVCVVCVHGVYGVVRTCLCLRDNLSHIWYSITVNGDGGQA